MRHGSRERGTGHGGQGGAVSEAGNEEHNVSKESRGPRPASHGPRASRLQVQHLAEALAPNELAKLGTDDLVAFLAPRRWFGAKAGKPSAARVRDAVALPWEGGRFAIARVEVTTAEGRTSLYQLPLSV